MLDLKKIKQALDERDILKGHCKNLVALNREYEEAVVNLVKANNKLKKFKDPGIEKVLIDLIAQADRANGLKSIEAEISTLKKPSSLYGN